jgi:Carbohydrate esterase, sialic acid-specific acetylesterase/Chitobiase/beta-hexosaminidase C-terminal domain/F5/8 type C domain/Secretion system C-terminal sorting domain
MNKVSRLLSVFFLCALTQTVLIAQTNIDVFILAGQSNAQGFSTDANLYPTNAIDTAIKLNWSYFNGANSSGQWINMQPQIGRFGPEVTFSRNLKTAGYNPAIFKYFQPGTGLAVDWKAPGAGGIYDAMVVAYKAAIKKLTDAGNTVTVRGFVWIQGESDATPVAVANAYQANLTNLINDIRFNVVGNTCLPFVVGVDEQFPGDFITTVVQAQKNIVANIPKVAFTSMIGLPKADYTHLTSAGVITQGTRVYDSYTTLFANPSAFTSCTGPTLAVSTNKPSGPYLAPLSVALTAISGATIRYTTDGLTPTATTGTVYSNPIGINATTTLKAIAVYGTSTSAVLTATYTIIPNLCTTSTNLALNKTASQSSTYTDASRAVDGNTSGIFNNNSVTHTFADANAWWQVDLGAINNIDAVKLFNRTDCCGERLSDFYVLISDVPFTSTALTTTLAQAGVKSYFFSGAAGVQTDIAFGVTGRYVRVQLKTTTASFLHLAEVQVMGCIPLSISADKTSGTYNTPISVTLTGTSGATIRYTTDGSTPTATTGTVYSAPIAINTTTTLKAIAVSSSSTSAILTATYTIVIKICTATTNLALNKTATQSSTAFSGNPSRAVDGNTSGVWSNNSVTHTDSNVNAWWQVDLGAVVNIDVIKLFNRTDCCADRLSNFYVFVSQTAFTSTALNTTVAQAGVTKYLVSGTAGAQTDIPFNLKGRYVRVQLGGTAAQNLSLAEVQVFGCAVSTAAPLVSKNVLTIQGQQEGNKALISWVSENNKTVDYFTLEKRNLKTGDFETVETVKNGQLQDIGYFTSYDNAPTEGENFYRIKRVSTTGDILLSEVKVLVFSNLETVMVSPNPARDALTITFDKTYTDKAIDISLVNIDGKSVIRQHIDKLQADNHTLDIANQTSNGLYMLVIKAKGKRDVFKSVVITH